MIGRVSVPLDRLGVIQAQLATLPKCVRDPIFALARKSSPPALARLIEGAQELSRHAPRKERDHLVDQMLQAFARRKGVPIDMATAATLRALILSPALVTETPT